MPSEGIEKEWTKRALEIERIVKISEEERMDVEARLERLYRETFEGLVVRIGRRSTEEEEIESRSKTSMNDVKDLFKKGKAKDTESFREVVITSMSEEDFVQLGRKDPSLFRALTETVSRKDKDAWLAFQTKAHELKLKKERIQRSLESARLELGVLKDQLIIADAASEDQPEKEGVGEEKTRRITPKTDQVSIVLITGFESFNAALYRTVADRLKSISGSNIRLSVFSDRDISSKREDLEKALSKADVLFASLLFDFDQVEWLQRHIDRIPIRLIFESSLELMSQTTIGSFQMKSSPAGGKSGPPAPVKAILSKFGSGREEDRMVGYLSFLKLGPKLLQFIPGKRARDLRNWLTVYSYWNQGGVENVVSMFVYLANEYFLSADLDVAPIEETPSLGLVHPGRQGYFVSPADYLHWHKNEYVGGRELGADAPVVGLLLYRKHVITKQFYIAQLIYALESEGLRPVPVFINGVEAHTIVRDWFTSSFEQNANRDGRLTKNPTLRQDAVLVDVVVSTIGFPLVGGPAGSMESGRQQDVAKSILQSKNVPYIVAAPLLVQDINSWVRDGIQGLQTVVMYALPELDGAIDTIPLGGLVGDNIFLAEERVKRLGSRIRCWVNLRKLKPFNRKISLVLYGFPPGVGATGTAALLNVPQSLSHVLGAMKKEGYDVGDFVEGSDGEKIVQALRKLEEQRIVSLGARGISMLEQADLKEIGGEYFCAEISAEELKEWLEYPHDWGPTEWGPQLTLPSRRMLLANLERQWGDLSSYQGLGTSADGRYVVSGIRFGKVLITVQPALGIEGDPLRLLFQRDLCPHPQYCSFYKWLQNGFEADAVVHFGMHGTVEWLPGSPLGNTGYSWSDVLLGNLPNVYIYAANNPSESIIAKRRGYGTIVSYNVPPYGRAGLYKELATLKEVLVEYREDPTSNANLKGTIVANADSAGLLKDCPFLDVEGNRIEVSPDMADEMDDAEFETFASKLYQYLQLVENRLFSEGLHTLGRAPNHSQMVSYLSAYFEDDLPEPSLRKIADSAESFDVLRAELKGLWESASGKGVNIGDFPVAKLEEAVEIRDLLLRNTEEMQSVTRALNGEYICPEAGGDLLRDGPGVLPTGRNIHALDPYRMPSPTAMDRGAAAAQAILSQHMDANGGKWPETVAVSLWGLDSIKTRGEALAIVLELIGARPVKEGTGRVVRFELQPLEDLVPPGRPRIDVLCNTSGIFRDSFANIIELLDDAFKRAAELDEPMDRNYIKKHASAMTDGGLSNPTARIFSNPAGDYGSMVNERVGAGDWEQGEELGDTWQSRYSFSYGRGDERGAARPEVLSALLKTTDRVVQQIDSVEYGLTDIQEYMANTGALKKAAETAKGGQKVDCSIVEAFGKEVRPRELDQVLRLEYRSRFLNPKWAEAMAAQGSGGAYEISQRMTALIGWGATADFKEDWVYDQAVQTYALDPNMAETLRKNNPQAFQNVLRRFLEASGRGMWKADEKTLDKLRALYGELDDELEGV